MLLRVIIKNLINTVVLQSVWVRYVIPNKIAKGTGLFSQFIVDKLIIVGFFFKSKVMLIILHILMRTGINSI